jgi:hypothetical protein
MFNISMEAALVEADYALRANANARAGGMSEAEVYRSE